MKRVVNLLRVCAIVVLCGLVAVFFTTCKKDAALKKEVFSGCAQKGPFTTGSSVTIFELDANLNQTGKTYFTTISDDFGNFKLTDIELVSNYVELKVEGYFFHEIIGAVVEAPIMLYTLVDVKDANYANVNVLTHLEKPRVEYLVKQGKSFAEAKRQAQKEVLAIFDFTPSNTSSEALDLTHDGMLLAISTIIITLPFCDGAINYMEFMANVSEDIKTDGILDNTALKTKLVKSAIRINTYDKSVAVSLYWVRKYMEDRYAELGINVAVPNFESYVQAFIDANK